MNDKRRKELLSELIKNTDYDIWKSFFLEDYIEDPEENEQQINKLLEIIKKYE